MAVSKHFRVPRKPVRGPGKAVRLKPAELDQLAALETRWHCDASTVLRRALHEAYKRETTRGRK